MSQDDPDMLNGNPLDVDWAVEAESDRFDREWLAASDSKAEAKAMVAFWYRVWARVAFRYAMRHMVQTAFAAMLEASPDLLAGTPWFRFAELADR